MSELQEIIKTNLDGMRRDGKIDNVTAAALSSINPMVTVLSGGGIAYPQNTGLIGDILLPPINVPGNELAAYKVFGKEAFLVLRDAAGASLADIVGINGEHLRADLSITTVNVALEVHGYSAWLDDRERAAAASMGENIEDQKAAMIKSKVDTGRESDAAALVMATGSYASATYYSTLASTLQWSHASSTPISVINSKIEIIRAATGSRENITLWLSPTAFGALRMHASILALVSGGATRAMPGMPIGTDLLAAIFGVKVVVGDAIESTTINGAVSDVWNDGAGLIVTGPANMDMPKFGATLVQAGWPVQRVERNPHLGAKGIDVLYYDDAYKHVVQLNTAGYLWLDTTA